MLPYVDNAISFVTNEPKHGERVPQPAQGLVNAATYPWAIHQMDIPHKNIQLYSHGENQVVLSTQESRLAHLGDFWTTDTAEQRGAVLAGGQEVLSHN